MPVTGTMVAAASTMRTSAVVPRQTRTCGWSRMFRAVTLLSNVAVVRCVPFQQKDTGIR